MSLLALHCNSPSQAACIWHGDCLIGMDAINIENIHASLHVVALPNARNSSRCLLAADPISGQPWRKQKASRPLLSILALYLSMLGAIG